jgi:hypothetical protein
MFVLIGVCIFHCSVRQGAIMKINVQALPYSTKKGMILLLPGWNRVCDALFHWQTSALRNCLPVVGALSIDPNPYPNPASRAPLFQWSKWGKCGRVEHLRCAALASESPETRLLSRAFLMVGRGLRQTDKEFSDANITNDLHGSILLCGGIRS